MSRVHLIRLFMSRPLLLPFGLRRFLSRGRSEEPFEKPHGKKHLSSLEIWRGEEERRDDSRRSPPSPSRLPPFLPFLSLCRIIFLNEAVVSGRRRRSLLTDLALILRDARRRLPVLLVHRPTDPVPVRPQKSDVPRPRPRPCPYSAAERTSMLPVVVQLPNGGKLTALSFAPKKIPKSPACFVPYGAP